MAWRWPGYPRSRWLFSPMRSTPRRSVRPLDATLTAPPFGLAPSVVGLLFVLYLAGTWTSVVAGRLADRRGRALVLGGALPITVTGLMLTLPHSLVAVVVGLGVFTGGFFAAHTVA